MSGHFLVQAVQDYASSSLKLTTDTVCVCVCNAVFSYGNASPGSPVSILPNDARLPLHVEGGDPT